MDTKVEQEVFGYDPNNPCGLDALHDHIHTDYEDLELRMCAVPEGLREEPRHHAEAMAGLTPEGRAAYKVTHYLELYGSANTNLG